MGHATIDPAKPESGFHWNPKRIAGIKAEHEKKRERFLKRKRINVLQVDVTDIDRDFMDEIYDEQEGGGACLTCYK